MNVLTEMNVPVFPFKMSELMTGGGCYVDSIGIHRIRMILNKSASSSRNMTQEKHFQK